MTHAAQILYLVAAVMLLCLIIFIIWGVVGWVKKNCHQWNWNEVKQWVNRVLSALLDFS